MALGLLLILFIFLSAVGGVGIIFLFWVQNPEKKKWILYLLALLGMAIAFLNASSLPSNYVAQQIAAWGIGFLSVASLLMHISGRPGLRLPSQILVSLSVIGGILYLFFCFRRARKLLNAAQKGREPRNSFPGSQPSFYVSPNSSPYCTV